MKRKAFIALCLLAAANAFADCGTIRIGYPDQHRPPYWMGNGPTVPEPPGAAVDFLRELAASGGCTVELVRLPMMRLRSSLISGAVDMAPVDITADGQPGIVMPRDPQGKPDTKRATTLALVAFVRAKDGFMHDADPMDLVRGKRVGVMYGSSYAKRLESAGAILDQGGPTVPSNFDKLQLGRIDAFVVPLLVATDMDKYVAERYKGELVRLEKPVLKSFNWIATNPAYYGAHRRDVDTLWNWIGTDGNKRFNQLLRKYIE
ncbi:transporter substrate-binding domain-containing protein [Pseudoduganella eburnea]|uniref:Transporter substrate-binding domain-containing protein n=1 Tax=Massilia eburnea TaxID=1776165 RepID=A0A6L6QEH1_9BURK|nr:transporter substrate-binding domain-containing protein [Massilia eburnea]MTW10589.1 transporter substrate-binding domain-containing protein [Massilia eburnea]